MSTYILVLSNICPITKRKNNMWKSAIFSCRSVPCNFTENNSTPHVIFTLVFLLLADKQNITTKKLSFHSNQYRCNSFRCNTRVILFIILSFDPPEEVILHLQNDMTSSFRYQHFTPQNLLAL